MHAVGDGGVRVNGDDLIPRQEQAIAALLACKTVKAAAKKSGVPLSTLYVWLQNPTFKRAYRNTRKVVVDHALAELGTLTNDAVAALKRNLKCDIAAVEVRAALGVLDKVIHGQTIADMQAEIDELREELEQHHADAREPVGGTETASDGGVSKAIGNLNDAADTHPDSLRSDVALPQGGADPRPVASGVPGELVHPPDASMLPASGENNRSSSEDADPLFE